MSIVSVHFGAFAGSPASSSVAPFGIGLADASEYFAIDGGDGVNGHVPTMPSTLRFCTAAEVTSPVGRTVTSTASDVSVIEYVQKLPPPKSTGAV